MMAKMKTPTTKRQIRKSFTQFTNSDWITWLDTHNWMLRSSANGVSYGGYRWPPIGKWTTCKDWDSAPVCGNGFHGNSPSGHGYGFDYCRLELCETRGQQVVIEINKVKVASARIIAVNTDIPASAFERCGWRVFYPSDGDTICPKDGEIYVITDVCVTVSGQSGGYCRFYDSSQGTVSGQSGGECWFYDSSQRTKNPKK